jgi:hypothetical protein
VGLSGQYECAKCGARVGDRPGGFEVTIFFVIWLIVAIAVGSAAVRRGRNFFGWSLISFGLSPLVAVLLLFAYPVIPLFNDRELARNIRKGRRRL